MPIAASARRQRMLGSSACTMPRVTLLRVVAIWAPTSTARSAMPVYTEAISSSKAPKMPITKGSWLGPTGVVVMSRSAVTGALCRRVVRDWVARMPWVSQSSLTSTASVRSSTPNTRRGSSSPVPSASPAPLVIRPWTTRRSHTGPSEVKILVPVNS